MPKRETRRSIVVPMDDERRQRWEQAVRETEAELPELMERGLKLRSATEEPTLSGCLRRAAQKSEFSSEQIVARLDISPTDYANFLTGDRPLPSDVLDRFAELLGYRLAPVQTNERRS